MRIRQVIAAVLMLLSWGGVLAGEKVTLAEIAEQQRALRADVQDGGLDGLTPRQNAQLAKAQDELLSVIEGKTEWSQLDIAQTIRVENALERINALVENTRAAEARRDTCWREAKTGSKVASTRCGTQQERDEAREGARAWMEKPKVCVPPGCGS